MQSTAALRSSPLAQTVCHWSPPNMAEIAKSYSVACSKTLTTFPDYENYKSYFEPLLFADISADLLSAIDKFHRASNSRPIKMRARREEAGTTLVPVTVQNFTSNHTYGFGLTVDVEPCDRKGPVGCVDNDVVALWQCEKPTTNKMTRLPQSRLISPLAVFAVVVRAPNRNGCRLLLTKLPASDPSPKCTELDNGEESNDTPSADRYWNILRVGALTTIKREFDAMESIRSSNLLPTLLRPHNIASVTIENKSNSVSATDHLKDGLTSANLNTGGLSRTSQQLEHNFTTVIAEKHRLNASQAQAILHGSTCDKGLAVIQGPPGTGKTRTLIALLNVIHMTQYQKYYEGLLSSLDEVHNSVTKKRAEAKHSLPAEKTGEGSLLESMMSAMNRTMETAMVDAKPATLTSRTRRPRLLICAPSNSAVDEVVTRLMKWRFYDGRGRDYCPELARIGAGDKVADAVKGVTAEGQAESFLERVCPEDATSEVQIEAQKSFLASWQQKCNTLLLQLERTPKTKESSRPVIIELHEKLERMERDLRRLKIVASSGLREDKLRYIARTYVEDAQLVFATLSGSGSGILANNASSNMDSDSCLFDTVVIDEAAQATEPSSLIPMTLGCSRCLLVGDPQQLPATTLASGAAGVAYGQSLLERVYRAGMNVQLLNTQYRMHPAISSFPRRYFYSGRLKDDESVQGEHRARPFHRDQIKPKLGPYVFLDISEGEERRSRDDRSIFNSSEAELASSIYSKLKKDYPTDPLFSHAGKAPGSSTGFGVITPYKRQMQELRQSFERNGVPTGDVEIDTVDSFQGREKDVVIFSCVRTAAAERGIGFVRDVRRMNVGLTRARSTLIILGSAHALAEGSSDWAQLVDDANSRGCLIRVNSVERCLYVRDDTEYDPDAVDSYATNTNSPNVHATTHESVVSIHNLKLPNNSIAPSNFLAYNQPQIDKGNGFDTEGGNVSRQISGNHRFDPRRRIIQTRCPESVVQFEDSNSLNTTENASNLYSVGEGVGVLDRTALSSDNGYQETSPEETLAQVEMVLREVGFEAVDVMLTTLREHVRQGGSLDIESVLAAAIAAKGSGQNLDQDALNIGSEAGRNGSENVLNEHRGSSGSGEMDDVAKCEENGENVRGEAPTSNANGNKNVTDTTNRNENGTTDNNKDRRSSKDKPKEPSGWEMLFGGESSEALKRKRKTEGDNRPEAEMGNMDNWGVGDGPDDMGNAQNPSTRGTNFKRFRGARDDGEGRGVKGRGRSRDRARKRGRGRGRGGRTHGRAGNVDEHDKMDEECGEEWVADGVNVDANNQGTSAPNAQPAQTMGVYGDVATMQALHQQAIQQQMMQQPIAFHPHAFQTPFQQQALQHHAMLMQMSGMVGGNGENNNSWYTSGFEPDNPNGGQAFNVEAFADDRHEAPPGVHGLRQLRGFRGSRSRGGRRR